jgi:hypothetical protein
LPSKYEKQLKGSNNKVKKCVEGVKQDEEFERE